MLTPRKPNANAPGLVPALPDDATYYLDGTGAFSVPASGSGAPTNAQYVTLATDATLTVERVLTAGVGITLTDNGAGSTIVITGSMIEARTSDPGSPVDGQIWLRTDL